MLKYHYRVARVQVFVNFIISSGDILLHSKILLCISAKFSGMLSFFYKEEGLRGDRGVVKSVRVGGGCKTMFATTFLATIKKN